MSRKRKDWCDRENPFGLQSMTWRILDGNTMCRPTLLVDRRIVLPFGTHSRSIPRPFGSIRWRLKCKPDAEGACSS